MRYAIPRTTEIRQIEKKMSDFAKEAVAHGAELLDKHNPGWESKINPAELLLSHTDACILGQTYGDYDDGKAALTISDDQAWEMGFVIPVWGDYLTTDELDIIANFEEDNTDCDIDLDAPLEVIRWEREAVYYGFLNYHWRQLLESRGYEANGTPVFALIVNEWKHEVGLD